MRFSVHRRRRWGTVAIVLGLLSLVEVGALELALRPAAPLAATLVSLASLSTLVWLVRDVRALGRGGVQVAPAGLDLRIGRRWSVALPWRAIERIERVSAAPARAPDLVRAGILGTDVVVHLRASTPVRGPMGLRRAARRIALSIDDVAGFEASIAPHLAEA